MKPSLRVPFVGGSYELARKAMDVQRAVNLCPTQVESGNAKSRLFLKATPGLRQFSPPPVPAVTDSDLFTLDWAFEGQPFCDVVAHG